MTSRLWTMLGAAAGFVRGDILFSLRTLRRNGVFTGAAVLTLAVGIAINTAVFSVFNAVALRPLPVSEGERVVSLYQSFRGTFDRQIVGSGFKFSYYEYQAYAATTGVFSSLSAYADVALTMRGNSTAAVQGALATGNYFAMLDGRAMLGRTFTREEGEAIGAAPVAVLRYGFWQDRFGGASDIVGQSITFNNVPITVIGVMEPGFAGSDATAPDVWLPLGAQPLLSPARELISKRQAGWLTVIGRLRPGVTIAGAAEAARLTAKRLDLDEPGRITDLSLDRASLVGGPGAGRKVLRVAALAGTAGCLMLLMTCANVANLVLARGIARRKELAVRLSLGAARSRLISQLAVENLLIALLGGALGFVGAMWLSRLIVAATPTSPVTVNLVPDLTVYVYTFAVSVFSGMLFGLLPAWQATRLDINTLVKDDRTSLGRWQQMSRQRSLLVIAQVALSLTLLIGAGLLVRGLRAAQQVDLGFDAARLVTASFDVSRRQGYDARRIGLFQDRLVETLKASPAISAVSLAAVQPLSGTQFVPFSIPGRGEQSGTRLTVGRNAVTGDYFATMGITILRGRVFSAGERDGAAVISESLARTYWPTEDALGKVFRVERAYVVIGIARTVRSDISAEPVPMFYAPIAPDDRSNLKLVVRAAQPAAATVAIRDALETIDPSVSADVWSVADRVATLLRPAIAGATVSALLALLALLLASMGIYAVVAYLVSQGTHEIALRLALGAGRADVVALVLRLGLRPVGIGVAAGLVLAVGLASVIRSALVGISPFDPAAFAGASAFLVAVATGAVLVPALRACREDPAQLLRSR